jgi:hypothetical protein
LRYIGDLILILTYFYNFNLLIQELKMDSRGVYEASLEDGGIQRQPCLLSGYPVYSNGVSFDSGKQANKDDWQKFGRMLKAGNSQELAAILKFITQWCGNSTTFSM